MRSIPEGGVHSGDRGSMGEGAVGGPGYGGDREHSYRGSRGEGAVGGPGYGGDREHSCST